MFYHCLHSQSDENSCFPWMWHLSLLFFQPKKSYKSYYLTDVFLKKIIGKLFILCVEQVECDMFCLMSVTVNDKSAAFL